MQTILRAGSVAIWLGAASGAFAQTPISLTISDNQAQGTISLSDGDVSADLTITFENPVGLTDTALEASAQIVDPQDPDLVGRLPAGTSIQSAFPVLLQIGPAASSGFSFSSVATVGLHTHNLAYSNDAPQSLLKAHDGGSFLDITASDGVGSYRVTGSLGDFSEFLIVRDARGDDTTCDSAIQTTSVGAIHAASVGEVQTAIAGGIDAVILGKFDALQATLTTYSGDMPLLVAIRLQARLTAARTLYLAGSLLPVVDKLTSLESYIVLHSGADIPGVWDADNPALINVAGLLRAEADTLKFSLGRKASQ
jgi:hypothetical protein